MTQSGLILIYLAAAFVAANLPWLSNRIFWVIKPGHGEKSAWFCWLEWLLLLLIAGVAGLALEAKVNGHIHSQGWEFYAVGFLLFLTFALPGFIYRYELRKALLRLK